MTYRLEIIDYSMVKPLAADMGKAGVVSDDNDDTIWVGALDNVHGTLLAVTAITTTKRTSRLRSSYVLPCQRGKGVYREMIAKCEDIARFCGSSKVTAFFNARTVPYAKANGYTIKPENKNGVYFASKLI